jgi:hypothetical protein
MILPFTLDDIALLLVVASGLLLLTSEILSPRYGKINVLLDRKKLRNTGLATSVLALISVVALMYLKFNVPIIKL